VKGRVVVLPGNWSKPSVAVEDREGGQTLPWHSKTDRQTGRKNSP